MTRDPDRVYEPVIGLEIHVQLRTRTKMFCGCALSFGEEPNTRTCPICLGHPGVLPVINAEAVHYALMIGMALECEIADRSIFHRKQYFYPDNPKAYQISQYDVPICGAGHLGDVRIHRVHLEEDAAKLVHAGSSGRIHGAEHSTVDFNRCGTPLVEIVTEPDLHDSKTAGEWLRLLRATLKRLGVSDVNMEEGSLRCDANVSLRHAGSATLGTKTELKNMNSFRFLERGIEAELKRQEAILREGGEVEQETLHFDPQSGSLSSLRSKEEAHDYRYFPEPDLVAVAPTPAMLDRARGALPELPAARAERFKSDLGLNADTAKLLAFRSELGDLYEEALSTDGVDPKTLANWVTQESAAADVEPAALAKLVTMVSEKTVSAAAARQVLEVLAAEGGDPAEIVERQGLGAQAADELGDIIDKAIAENADAVEKIKAGKGQAIGAIVGAVMRETKGRADGGEVQKLIRERLRSSPPAREPATAVPKATPALPDLSFAKALQRSISPFSDPAFSKKWQRSISPLADPSFSKTWQRSVSPLADPSFAKALQRSVSPFSDPSFSKKWQRSVSPLADPSFSNALRKSISPLSDPSFAKTWQRSISPLADPAFSNALQRSISPLADPSFAKALQTSISPMADPTLGKRWRQSIPALSDPHFGEALRKSLSTLRVPQDALFTAAAMRRDALRDLSAVAAAAAGAAGASALTDLDRALPSDPEQDTDAATVLAQIFWLDTPGQRKVMLALLTALNAIAVFSSDATGEDVPPIFFLTAALIAIAYFVNTWWEYQESEHSSSD